MYDQFFKSMGKTEHDLLEEIEKLRKRNEELHELLRTDKESMDVIKSGKIDAWVVAEATDLKVYTEKTSDKIYRILIEEMHEGAVTLSEDGIILYANSFFARLIDLPLQKVIGTNFKTYIDGSSVGSFNALFKLGWQGNSQNEVSLLAKEGKIMPVLMSFNVLFVEGIPVLSVIVTDLTIHTKSRMELKRKSTQLQLKNIELENINKDLNMLTYISSHDLQEPLRKIQGFMSVILSDADNVLSEASEEYFQRAQAAAKRMQALIADLLTYSRAKNLDRKFEKVKLNLIVDEIKRGFEELIREKKATIEAGDLGEATIIQFQFRQLISNLIGNSLKFSKPQIALCIQIKNEIATGDQLNNAKLAPTTSYSHITYSDNGIGFDQQYGERIFEIFQRLHSHKEYEGTGMGLAICKRIVENHNGIITASGELGVGARFDIYIPNL